MLVVVFCCRCCGDVLISAYSSALLYESLLITTVLLGRDDVTVPTTHDEVAVEEVEWVEAMIGDWLTS